MIPTNRTGLVLIIEDDPNTSSLVETYLKREGFQTRVAADGERGLELAQRLEPIFVVLDVMRNNFV